MIVFVSVAFPEEEDLEAMVNVNVSAEEGLPLTAFVTVMLFVTFPEIAYLFVKLSPRDSRVQ